MFIYVIYTALLAYSRVFGSLIFQVRNYSGIKEKKILALISILWVQINARKIHFVQLKCSKIIDFELHTKQLWIMLRYVMLLLCKYDTVITAFHEHVQKISSYMSSN